MRLFGAFAKARQAMDSEKREEVVPGSAQDSIAYWEARKEPAPYMVLLRDRNRLADEICELRRNMVAKRDDWMFSRASRMARE